MNAASIVDSSTGVLLDFDGPVCSIFANLPAPGVAEDLRRVLRHHDVAISDELPR
jgi:phosphoglycolate phosphatase